MPKRGGPRERCDAIVAKCPEMAICFDSFQIGELLIHSPSTMRGYWLNPVATAESFVVDADGKRWLKTGDVGYFDDNSTIYLVDRIKEMIKYKGHQVGSRSPF